MTVEQLMKQADAEIPGVKPLKNLNLLTQMEVKTGIAILIPRKKGETAEDDLSPSPINTQRMTQLDRRDSIRSVHFEN
jgi:hypothetical protein